MTTPETMAEYFGLTYRVIHWQLDGVTHEESLLQPPFRGNCLNWVLGHIVFGRESVLKLLGEDLPWTETEIASYRSNTEPITNAEQALPLEMLLGKLEESHKRILTGLKRITPDKWEAPINDETVAEKIAFSHWHETYHVGQLELLRQLAGKNDKVI
jgi:DinB superfamily